VGRRRGLQAEVLASLAVVVATATAVLGALLLETHQANVRRLRPLVGRALLQEAEGDLATTAALLPELRWWQLEPDGAFVPRGSHAERLDPTSRALALEALEEGRSLLRSGSPWDSVRFAAPVGRSVLVARLPPAASGALLLLVLLGDGLVFTAFGAYLLRGQLVRPLERLAQAARAIAAGDLAARAPAEGPRETQEVARSFNAMTEALAARNAALEKAVSELRASNRSLREAREDLDRAHRLASVGRLAAGVAHEVGNPLGAMLAFVDLAQRDPALGAEGRRHLDRVVEEGRRVRSILRQLLDFSSPRRTQLAPIDLVGLARETAGLLRAQQRYAQVEIAVEAVDDPPAALADRGAVTQVLLNLLLNAAEAVAATAEPRVVVRVRPAVLHARQGDDPARAARLRGACDAVECVVRDNGPGVADEDRERIFDPFFTTRAPGEGTGLGLSNALRLAEELGGGLALLAADDAPGAAFCLRLPAAGVSGGAAARHREADVPPPQV
jgi:signal transduction histidine kinase